VALRGDGKVFAWGDNTYGQTNVPSGLSNVVAVAAGVAHSLALLTNGTLVAWGDPTAIEIPANLTNVVGIAAGDYASLALRADGSYTWFGDTLLWSDEDFPADLSHLVAVVASGDNFSAIINDNRSLVLTGKVSTAFSYQIQPAGRNKYYAIGLPSGLTVSASSGLVSGTPTVAGSWSTLLGTRNAVTNAAQVFRITISP
jgi:trimeric autotransporter adhesin